MADIFKVGNGGGVAPSFSVDDAGGVTVSDGTTPQTLTYAIWTKLVGLGGFVWDLTGATTGAAYVGITANLASAFAIKQGSTALLDFVTTTSKVFVKFGGRVKFGPVTTVAMSNAAHALVLGTATTGQTQLAGRRVIVTPGGTGLTLTLPAVADSAELELVIQNAGSDTFTVGGMLTASVAQGKAAIAVCDGANWYSYAIG